MDPSTKESKEAALSAENLSDDYCAYHNAIEPYVEHGYKCMECWHQFASEQDLLNEHNIAYGAMEWDINKVFSCPFCLHDL